MKKWVPLATSICLSAVLLAGCGNEEINQLNEPETINDPVNGTTPNNAETPANAEPDPSEDEENNTSSTSQDQSGMAIGDTAEVESNVDHFKITLDDVRFIGDYEGTMSEFDDFAIVQYTVENLSDEPLDAYEAIYKFELDGLTDISAGLDSFEPISGQLQTGETATGEAIYYTYEETEHQIAVSPGIASVGGIDDISWDFERTPHE
ncbi:hypothetical protein [Paenibacillus daejeonensis]|uniref:hypothetical protein n=1 Tax=Paenibacillus daejeonensis TaxID=135193 RepID=UPI000364C341|nr:hypothetical protein [Paenibacillus daejeonensis]